MLAWIPGPHPVPASQSPSTSGTSAPRLSLQKVSFSPRGFTGEAARQESISNLSHDLKSRLALSSLFWAANPTYSVIASASQLFIPVRTLAIPIHE